MKGQILLISLGSLLYLRGPDSFNYRSFENNTIGISRLSIVDINNESQPFILESSGITAVFNGEIYNYKDLRRSLISEGIKFRSNSEIEVIAYLYKLHREKFVDFLDGMYAIAIFDVKNSSFNIFRDPMELNLYIGLTRKEYLLSPQTQYL